MYRRIPQSFNKAFALLIHMSNLEEYSSAFMFSRVGDLKLFFTKKACSLGGDLEGMDFYLVGPTFVLVEG